MHERPTAGRVAWFARAWAVLALALFLGTWRLWTPQTMFPQAPLFAIGRNASWWIDWLFVGGAAMGLAITLVTANAGWLGRTALLLFAGSVLGLILLDQHRLQPWAWQFVLIAVVLATREGPHSFVLLRCLAIGIYFWSSLGKFDHVFLHGVGQQFLVTGLGWFGWSPEAWSPALRLWAACVFPAGELLIAVGLCFRPTRRVALVGAATMHLSLLALLGPLGLDHQPGVLLWNVFFLVQAVFLFGPWKLAPHNASRHDGRGADSEPVPAVPPEKHRVGVAEALIVLAIALPALEPWQLWDHWLSWGLYSTRAERVAVYVHRLAVFRLPDDVQPFVRPPAEGGDWQELQIDRWSLEALGAPLYPQARFQLGVAEAVGRRNELGGLIQAIRFSPADRWTGERRRETLLGVDAIAAAIDKSWFNGHPRWTGQDLPPDATLSR